ncbi:MAG: hypothetical protein AB9856_20780 [Cellulosilyticaceae bacterium]
MEQKLICPICNSTKVFQFVSVGAKRKLNGKGVLYEIGHGGLDNEFDTVGCEECEWEGNIDDLVAPNK